MPAFTPWPLTSSFKRTVRSWVAIAVTSYSLPSSPEMWANAVASEDASAVEKEIISPTLNAVPASTLIVVAPAASSPTVWLDEPKFCSYAVALGQRETPIELPHVPAVRAAHSKALSLGSEVVHSPQVFLQYHPNYFASFWLDPEGFMLEALCLGN